MPYSKWDEVVLSIEDSFGYGHKLFSKLKVIVIGYDCNVGYDVQYLCYVPPYETVPCGFKTFKITQAHIKYFNADKKFLGDYGCFITKSTQIHKHAPAETGEKCDRCGIWCGGAERGFNDDAFMCSSCRTNPYR